MGGIFHSKFLFYMYAYLKQVKNCWLARSCDCMKWWIGRSWWKSARSGAHGAHNTKKCQVNKSREQHKSLSMCLCVLYCMAISPTIASWIVVLLYHACWLPLCFTFLGEWWIMLKEHTEHWDKDLIGHAYSVQKCSKSDILWIVQESCLVMAINDQ